MDNDIISSLKTRSASSHSVFGSPLPELPLTELPTRLQVGRYFLSLKDSKYSCNKDIVPQVSQTLIDLWTCARSEEHTSELQSQSNLVCRLLLEKKKKKITTRAQREPVDARQ